jgi:hypothetical protein
MQQSESRGLVASSVAQFARVLGAILLLGGAGHVLGVSAMILRQGPPSRDRLAFLAFVALAHWSAGALNLLSAAALRRRDLSATPAIAIALGIVAGWAAIQLPAFIHHPTVISSGPLAYFIAQTALLAAAVARARMGSRRAAISARSKREPR